MFITETLDKCTVIRIHNLVPKKIKTPDFNSELKDGFLLMVRDKEKLIAFQNLGFTPTDAEKAHLKQYVSTWGGGEQVDVKNGVLEMELPIFLKPFIESINNIPGCRISPNLLRIGGDVYLSVEYTQISTGRVNQVILDFINIDHLFRKNLIYSGSQGGRIPILLKIYQEAGNTLEDFTMITSVWEMDKSHQADQNLGVFTNLGTYVPKSLINDSNDLLIFRKSEPNITGNAEYTVADPDNNIVEFKVTSKFFSDFYNFIIRNYSGPIYMHPVVTRNRHTTYFIIEGAKVNLFLSGLYNHWSTESRKDHVNYIGGVERLDLLLKRLKMEDAQRAVGLHQINPSD